MIIGDPLIFAIESGITQAYASLGLRALGFFVIYVAGQRYGVYRRDATMLACSFDEVARRIARRGAHAGPFSTEPDAGKIADSVYRSLWASDQEEERFFGIPQREFHTLVCSSDLEWAPDGDEAFDDDSHVLHFDVGDRVRLIAFRSREQVCGIAVDSVSEVWLPADTFYNLLQQWHDAFESEWASLAKVFEEK